MADFAKHLKELKFMYSGVLPSLRTKAIKDRLNNPNCGPNKLILEVSATEGIARTILIKLLVAKGLKPKNAFKKTSALKIKEVFKNIYELKEKKARSFFNSKNWKVFVWAIEYRNFLIHHCAYVGGAISNPLIEATTAVRGKIEREWL